MLKILSCNVRIFGADDGADHWLQRKDLCMRVISRQDPDIIGFQEMWAEQQADVCAAFPDYAHFTTRDEPGGGQPMNSIFYKRTRFDCVSAAGYWLSETPHVPGSRSWDSMCVRLANWLHLRDRVSGKEFRIINTHLDHRGQSAREEQARIICEDAAAYPESFGQILSGDMNCDCTNPAIKQFLASGWQDSYAAIHGPAEPGHTFHKFKGPARPGKVGKMDWIFSRGGLRATAAAIIDDHEQGRYPSDHYFISASFAL